MKLLPILLFLCAFNSLTASQVLFNKASDNEALTLQSHLIDFYSQELLQAGLFTDEASALQAAKEEVALEAANNPLYFFHLASDECRDTHFGYMTYAIKGKTVYIEGLYLDEKYRGQGLGKETLLSLENKLRGTGIKDVKLFVFAQNVAALKLYGGMGYLIETTYSDGGKLIGHHMRKNI